MRETWVDPWVGKILLEKGKATHSSILAWRIPWTCIVHGVTKSWTQQNDFHLYFHLHQVGFPGGSDGKESACNAEDLGWSLGWEDCPGEGKGYPLQYSGLENSMDRGAWQTTVLGVPKGETQLSSLHFASGGQNTGASASASVLLMNIRYYLPLGLTGLISLLYKVLSTVFSSTII